MRAKPCISWEETAEEEEEEEAGTRAFPFPVNSWCLFSTKSNGSIDIPNYNISLNSFKIVLYESRK